MRKLINWIKQVFKGKESPQKDYWYNFDTGKFDLIVPPTDHIPYIPPGSARTLYRLYIDHQGLSALESVIKVLEQCGEVPPLNDN